MSSRAPLEYVRADDVASAVALVSADPGAAYLAGGTTQLDLMLKDGVIDAGRLVDITRLPLRGITRGDGALRVGALTTMEELAADPTVARAAAAGPRGAAGGRLAAAAEHGHDRREPAAAHPLPLLPRPGRGGLQQARAGFGVRGGHAARRGCTRSSARSEHCIAVHASDLCVALVALDARRAHPGRRRRAQRPADRVLRAARATGPTSRTCSRHGELITAVRRAAAAAPERGRAI